MNSYFLLSVFLSMENEKSRYFAYPNILWKNQLGLFGDTECSDTVTGELCRAGLSALV